MKTLLRVFLCLLCLLALPARAAVLDYACERDGEQAPLRWQPLPQDGFFRLFEADFRRGTRCWIRTEAANKYGPQPFVLHIDGVPQALLASLPAFPGAAPAPLQLRTPRDAVFGIPADGAALVRLDVALPIGGAVHIHLEPAETALTEATHASEIHSALLTILFAMGLVSALFAYALRDGTMAWYTGFTLCIGVVWAVLSGYAVNPTGLAESHPMLAQDALLLGYGLTLLCGTQFGRRLSCLPERARRFDRFISAAALALLGYTAVGLLPGSYAFVMEYYNLAGLIMLVLLLMPGGVALGTGGYRAGAFYLIGWLPIIASWIGVLLVWMHLMPDYPAWARRLSQALHDLGWVPEWLGSPYVREAALLVQAAVFSLALADRAARLRYARERAAMTDKVCGLPNRASFLTQGARLLSRLRGRQRPLTLVLIDIDRFAAINEALGYDCGDQVLREMGMRLGHKWGDALTARVGANQFAVLLEEQMGVESLRMVLASLARNTIEVDDQRLDISLSCGAACFPEHGRELDVLLRHAEVALAASRHETHRVLMFHAGLETDRRFQLSLLSALRTAMAQRELQLFLQPKVERSSGRVTGAEVLLRWHHPQLGLISPAEFLPFAMQSGLILELTRWTLEQALALAKHWQMRGLPLRLSVNLSAHDLADPNLPAHVSEYLMHSRADPRLVCLEITESEVMRDPKLAIASMHALRKLGFQLAIDDFGTGNSSLAYLQEMPVAEVKIDRSFISNARLERGRKLLFAVVSLCQTLGLRTVAEGVESEAEWAMMADAACDEVQGYYVSAPLPPSAFDEWLKLNQPFVTSAAAVP